MRSAARIGSTPREWKTAQEAERARALREALAELERCRGEPWYRWIVEEWAPRRRAAAA